MKSAEVLAGDRRCQQAAQCLPPATFRSHASPQCVSLAERCDGPGALVARAGPRVTADLARQRPDSSLVLEAVSVLEGALAAGLAAIQTRAAWAAGDDDL